MVSYHVSRPYHGAAAAKRAWRGNRRQRRDPMVKQTVTVTLGGGMAKGAGRKTQQQAGAGLFSNSMKKALGVGQGGGARGKKLPPGDLRSRLGNAKNQGNRGGAKVTFQNEERGGGLARHAGVAAGGGVRGQGRLGRVAGGGAQTAKSVDDADMWAHDMYFVSGQATLESSTAPPDSYLVGDAHRRARGGVAGRQAPPSRALYKAGLLSSAAAGGGGVRVAAKGGGAVVKKKGRGTFTFSG